VININKSDSIKEIAAAMIKVQNEIKGMTPDAKNPFFKSNYITLDGILEYIRPILTQNQIWILQEARSEETHVSIKTSLVHSSGEFIETESLGMNPSKNDPQALGSLCTYLKRYQLASLMGISSEIDDDGNGATHGKQPIKPPYKAPQPKEESKGILNDKQIQRLYSIAHAAGVDHATVLTHILAKFKLTSTTDLSKTQYDEMCKGYEAMKKDAK